MMALLMKVQVCEEEEVLDLDAQSLADLLASDDLNISKEEVMLELVLRWVAKRRGDSQCEAQAVELLRHVRLELVDPVFLQKAQRKNPNHPEEEPDKLSNRVFQFDPGKDRWKECARMKHSRYRFGAAILNGEIYVLGGIGCDGEDCGQSRRSLSCVEIYNSETDTWRPGPSLPTSLLSLRNNTSNAGGVQGKLYLCGYYKGASRHEIITKEVLELDPAVNAWAVVERHAAMHDSYDVCVVANLNPRDLLTQ